MGHISQKLFEEIFIPVDHFQPNFLGVLSQCVKSFLVFLVRMDVGIEKISDNFFPFFSDSFKGIDGTVGTADVEEDFHYSSLKFKVQNPNVKRMSNAKIGC